MPAVKESALALVSGEISISDSGAGVYLRAASITDLNLAWSSATQVEVRAHDTKNIRKYRDALANISSNLYEMFDVDLIKKILGGTKTITTGTPVPVTGEALGTGWTVGQPIKLENKNGDNTIATSITVYENAVALVAGTDYNTYVGDGSNGDLGYTYIVPLTAATLAITADYTYTPNASTTWTQTSGANELPIVDVKIEGTDSTGKIRRLIAYGCTFSGDLTLPFVDVIQAGDGGTTSFAFEQGSGYDVELYQEDGFVN